MRPTPTSSWIPRPSYFSAYLNTGAGPSPSGRSPFFSSDPLSFFLPLSWQSRSPPLLSALISHFSLHLSFPWLNRGPLLPHLQSLLHLCHDSSSLWAAHSTYTAFEAELSTGSPGLVWGWGAGGPGWGHGRGRGGQLRPLPLCCCFGCRAFDPWPEAT